MYRSLYRKYRPATFEEVCGRDEIIAILKNQIKTGKTAHAYLFCGTRGTGKTTCAKILARAVNCLSPKDGNPCGECEACRIMQSGLNTDIVEMDAASNNGVGDVRELIDELIYTPSELKKRVYIIDEVHMMSASAFNALLKTLEEPPEHVIFILATTELNKLPATIISRCQRYDFNRLTNSVICKRLRYVADCEGIDIDDDALFVIAKLAQGGMRDALVYLELCMDSRERITAKVASSLFGVTAFDQLLEIVRAISECNMSGIFKCIGQMYASSQELNVFWGELIGFYRDMLVCKCVENYAEHIECTPAQANDLKSISVRFTKERILYHISVLNETLAFMQKNPSLKKNASELALIRLCDPSLELSLEALGDRVSRLEDRYSALKLKGASTECFLPNEDEEKKPEEKSAAVTNDEKKPPEVRAITELGAEEKRNTSTELKSFKKWADISQKLISASPASSMYLTDSCAYEGQGKLFVFLSSPITLKIAEMSRENIVACICTATDGKYDTSSIELSQKPCEDDGRYKLIDELE